MEVWQWVRCPSRITKRLVSLASIKSLCIECVMQVKRIIVPQRENPIVNRLNKTKVEKFPDLAMEKEEKLKVLRKKDQAAKLDRVSFLIYGVLYGLTGN
jgi:hypothetical protein